jgi:hypothetical protein
VRKPAVGVMEVSTILGRERHLTALLVGMLQRAEAPAALVPVRAALRRAALLRAVEVHALAATWGLPAGVTLAELAAAAPPPWSEVLAGHGRAFRDLEEGAPPHALGPSLRDFLGQDAGR